MPPATEFPTIPPMPGYGNTQGKVAETPAQKLRRECREWINYTVYEGSPVGSDEQCNAIMEHCFGVALRLLGKDEAAEEITSLGQQVEQLRSELMRKEIIIRQHCAQRVVDASTITVKL